MATPAAAQVAAVDCLDYSDHPHWLSQLPTVVWATDVLVDGELAYLAIRTGGIVVVDISDPGQPRQIGELVGAIQVGWSACADALALSGQHLFVADGYFRKIHVLDVSDPTAPFLVTQVATGDYPKRLAVRGDVLYAAVQETGLEVYDIADPTVPVLLTTRFIPGGHGVRVADGLLLVASLVNGLSIFDLADPAAPALLDRVGDAVDCETWDVAVHGDLAYVATPFNTWIVDIADPAAASLTATIPFWATSIVVDGDRAYLTTDGLEILDLSDPLDPVRIASLPMPSVGFMSWVRRVALADGFAVTAADDAGLMVADVAGAPAPFPVPVLELPATAERATVRGEHLLVAARASGLLVIDIVNPTLPALASQLETFDARDVTVDGTLAYLADGGDGLKIVDLSDPAAPQVLGHYDTYSQVATGLALAGDRIFLATDLGDLKILDVDDPAAPTLLGQIALPGRAQDVCVIGDLAFVAADAEGLQVVDAGDPAAPSLVAALELDGRQQAVVLDGTTLFIGGIGTGLRTIDVTVPTAPVVLCWLPVEAQDLALDGDFLYAAGDRGVTVIDRSDPSALATAGFLFAGEDCPTVAIDGADVLIAGDRLHYAPAHCPGPSGAADGPPPPHAWARLAGHPNPFNPRLEIEFELAAPRHVSLEVVDVAGRRLRTLIDGPREAALQRTSWDGRDEQGRTLPSGTYFLVLRGQGDAMSRKVTLVR